VRHEGSVKLYKMPVSDSIDGVSWQTMSTATSSYDGSDESEDQLVGELLAMIQKLIHEALTNRFCEHLEFLECL
jgi:hypothetical protein